MSSSLWMRGAPQVGFSATIRKIRSRTSQEILLRPTRLVILDIMLQYRRNPERCQCTTVSGVATRSNFFQSDQNLRATAQKNLSRTASLGRRFSTREYRMLTKCEVRQQQVLP